MSGRLAGGLLAVLSFELPFWVAGALSLAAGWIVWLKVPETVSRS